MFQNFDYKVLIFFHELHLLYVHFREYMIQGAFVSLCSTIIIPSPLQQTTTTCPHDDIHTCHSDYSKRNTYQIHHPVWLTSYVWEFQRKVIHAFIRRKGGRMIWENNKSTTPSVDFPFSLILNKTGSFLEKEDIRFGGYGIKKTC